MDQEHHELFDLAVLCNVSQALASTVDLDQLLLIVIDEVNKALLTEGSGVLLYDENRGDLYWRQVKDARKILAHQTEVLRFPMDRSIAGWVFQNNKSAIVNDTSKDPRYYPGISEKSGFEIRKVLQVPLRSPEKTIGVLMAMNKIGGDFTEQDEALLSSMASSVALAVDNATFYKKLKQSRDALEILYRSSMALATTMDLDHLLEVIISDLRSAMETEAGGVLLYDESGNDLYWREVQDNKGLINAKGVDLRLPIEGSRPNLRLGQRGHLWSR
jgi:GAF domain-containing protein